MAWNGVSTLPSYVKVFDEDTISFVDSSDYEIGSIGCTIVPLLWFHPPGGDKKLLLGRIPVHGSLNLPTVQQSSL